MANQRIITDAELEEGLDLLAELIDRYGEVYWPIFERLEKERNARNEKVEKLSQRLNNRSACHFA